MSENIKKEKQKKALLKIVGKLYKKDFEEILGKLFACKKGTKAVLRQRVIDFIETDKQDIDFGKIRKEIKRVYKLNPKIIKTPKKVKSAKKSQKSPKLNEKLTELRQKLLNDGFNGVEESDESTDSATETPTSTQQQTIPILNIPNPFGPPDRRSPQTVNNCDYNYETLSQSPNGRFQSTTSSSANIFEQFTQTLRGQPYPQQSSQNSSCVNTPMTFQTQPPFPSNILNAFNVYRNNNINQNQTPTPYSLSGEGVHQPPPPNPVSPQQLIRPMTNQFNASTQPINYSINNYFQNSPQNFTFHQNFFQNPMSDVLNPQTFDSLIEQQKFLLSQYPKSFQNDDKSTPESDVPITEFVFKCLPKFKAIKTLKETKTIGSLSDIGTEVIFDIKPTDLELNYFDNHMSDGLKTLLERKDLKILLRFTYVSDINLKEQKDLLPEYLCIECNNQRIFTYEEDCEDIRVMSGPFDLSDYCKLNQNRLKFFVKRENFTFLLPCIYEISIVSFDTCDTFLSKLKQNMFQFLTSDSTKQLIRSRNDQKSQDEIISINTGTKLKLICPLSCRRIETPCRTSECKHIECFDAHSFFKTNESRYDWVCPICQRCAQFDKLRIDGFISEILSSTDDNITEIFIKPDASYDVIQKNTEKEAIVIELDDSLSDNDIECSVIDADGCIVLD